MSNACGAGLAHDKLRSENHIYRFRACPQQSRSAQQCLRCAWRSRCASRSFSHAANPTLVPSTAEPEDRRTETSVLRTARARRKLKSYLLPQAPRMGPDVPTSSSPSATVIRASGNPERPQRTSETRESGKRARQPARTRAPAERGERLKKENRLRKFWQTNGDLR